jgi:CBS domain containing-hemolysin-like protein
MRERPDILEAIAGAFRSDVDTEKPAAVSRDDGSWLLAGWMPADEMADQLGITPSLRPTALHEAARRGQRCGRCAFA